MSNLRYSLSALDPTAGPTPSPTPSTTISRLLLPEAKSTPALLTTLGVHQLMLTNLYITQNNAYVSAYTAFATQCATGDITFMEIKDVVAKLLEQQKEIMLSQTFLWSFQALVVELESDETDEIDEGHAGRQGVCVGIGGGKLAKSINGMWR